MSPARLARPRRGNLTTKQTTKATQPARPAKIAKVSRPKRFDTRFLRETYSELKKVVWPSREEATNLTVIVIVVSLGVGLMLGLIDLGFFELINRGLLGAG